jgi:hypothetical protein
MSNPIQILYEGKSLMTSKIFQNNEQKKSAEKNMGPREGDVVLSTQELRRVVPVSLALTE